MPPVMSSDSAGVPKLGVCGVFFEGHRSPGLGQALNLLGKFEIYVAVKQHVHAIAQPSGADIFIAKIGVRNLALIERIAQPADRIGIGPRHPHADARRLWLRAAAHRGRQRRW